MCVSKPHTFPYTNPFKLKKSTDKTVHGRPPSQRLPSLRIRPWTNSRTLFPIPKISYPNPW